MSRNSIWSHYTTERRYKLLTNKLRFSLKPVPFNLKEDNTLSTIISSRNEDDADEHKHSKIIFQKDMKVIRPLKKNTSHNQSRMSNNTIRIDSKLCASFTRIRSDADLIEKMKMHKQIEMPKSDLRRVRNLRRHKRNVLLPPIS